jgi:hypothetical protein
VEGLTAAWNTLDRSKPRTTTKRVDAEPVI